METDLSSEEPASMRTFEPGAVRAFLVPFFVALTTPALFYWLGLYMPGRDANLMTILLPLLSGAYPFTLIPRIPPWLGIALSVVQMAALSALLARYLRSFPWGELILLSYVLLGVFAAFMDVVLAIFGFSIWMAAPSKIWS